MEIIYGGRQTGKTTKLLRMAAEVNGTILVHNYHEVERIKDLAKEMGLTIPEPLCYHEAQEALKGLGPTRKVLIDNVDWFLSWWLNGHDLVAVSAGGFQWGLLDHSNLVDSSLKE